MVRLSVKVVPRASRAALAGWVGGALKVTVTAPPEGGRANAQLLDLLSRALGLPREALRVVAGATGARKLIAIDGVDEQDLQRRLSEAGLGGPPA